MLSSALALAPTPRQVTISRLVSGLLNSSFCETSMVAQRLL